MDTAVNAVLHFDNLIWHWPIAIYLFLAGVSAGAVLISILFKRRATSLGNDPAHSSIVRAMALIAPVSVILGLAILVVDLSKPLEFWKMMIYGNPSSVMFWGVWGLSVYIGVLMLYLMAIFHEPMEVFAHFISPLTHLINLVRRWDKYLETAMVVLAIGIGAYTGLLLSALKAYPLLNNPLLPVLFLVSGLSSGAAATLLFAVLCFDGTNQPEEIKFIHKIEKPVLAMELALLALFFVGLSFGGAGSMKALTTALNNDFWSVIFWGFVIGGGIALPWLLQWLLPESLTHHRYFVSFCCILSLSGVFALRHFMLYTGQMVPA
ncbi:NrfD/PsrC family molybdoenzyme membrane anchor subunit [Ferrimonas lipolytica]|uniref:Polysulfide reductase NrfD n=1 Tax=Ferrimonas lipolytica TaxID=2724191 RepID=A0A6H1UFC8_9GAMM|nr:NrfD/PsrC family molybdoenzyme membrane anchor subunit [Ferrimonas lipolytica]QIZ77528.1 polysulfide reductase NrfD [Ferrimonas lipolytica]